MNLSQLSAFHAVMTSATLTEAAEKLGRTQPAISAAIKSLEDQLDMKLFERRGRKLIPVPEAQYLLAEADSILSRMSRVRQTMGSLSGGQAGTLKVAAMPGPVSMIFPRFIASSIPNPDDISISIQARTSNQIAELTRAQSIDFGFADAPESSEPEELYNSEIITADCLIALPADHPLSKKEVIAIEDLDGERIGTLPTSHRQSRDLRTLFDAKNLRFRAAVESQTFLPVLHFVAAGQCSTVLDPLSVFLARSTDAISSRVAIRPMTDPIRYRYAIYSPRYRPISVIAKNLRDAWHTEVMRLLREVGSDPALEKNYPRSADNSSR